MLHLKRLSYLVAIADYQHFGKAAESCFISQPTLSMQLRKLEQELDVVLVERHTKQVILTPTGQAVVNQARTILQQVQSLQDYAQQQNPYNTTLHLGLIPTVGPYLLPHIIPQIRDSLPNLQLFLHEEQTYDGLSLLRGGQLDAMILALPLPHQNFKHFHLYNERFYVATPNNHKLTAHTKVTSDLIPSEELLLLKEGHCLRDHALDICQKPGNNPYFEATSLETLRFMVASGNGLTILPETATLFNQAYICLLPFEEPQPQRDIVLATRQSSHLNYCLSELIRMIQHTISTLLTAKF